MRRIFDYIIGFILFIVILPLATVAVIVGFRQCWQCHKTKHIFSLRKYQLPGTKQLVCKECHTVLTRVFGK